MPHIKQMKCLGTVSRKTTGEGGGGRVGEGGQGRGGGLKSVLPTYNVSIMQIILNTMCSVEKGILCHMQTESS